MPNVLFVDDEPDIIKIMKKGLELSGFIVDAFSDPKQALLKFKPNYYNAIILDIRMPLMNGFELGRAIWAKDPNARICFFSAFEIYEHEAKKVFSSFKQYWFVRKPIVPTLLAKHIETQILTTK